MQWHRFPNHNSPTRHKVPTAIESAYFLSTIERETETNRVKCQITGWWTRKISTKWTRNETETEWKSEHSQQLHFESNDAKHGNDKLSANESIVKDMDFQCAPNLFILYQSKQSRAHYKAHKIYIQSGVCKKYDIFNYAVRDPVFLKFAQSV